MSTGGMADCQDENGGGGRQSLLDPAYIMALLDYTESETGF